MRYFASREWTRTTSSPRGWSRSNGGKSSPSGEPPRTSVRSVRRGIPHRPDVREQARLERVHPVQAEEVQLWNWTDGKAVGRLRGVSRNAGSVRDGVKSPAIGDAFELVLAAIGEHEPGAGSDVLHGLRCE